MTWLPIPASVPSDGDPLAERWYRALDKKVVDVGSESLLVDVVGIHSDGSELWIQLANENLPCEEVVLHVSRWTTLAQVLAAMECWRADENTLPHVVSLLTTQ